MTTDITANKQSAAAHLTAVIDDANTRLRTLIGSAGVKVGAGSDEFTVAAQGLVAAGQAFLAACDAYGPTIRRGYKP